MPYNKLPIGTANPGLIIVLLDQSSSMNDAYADGKSRAEFAAAAVNRSYSPLPNVIESPFENAHPAGAAGSRTSA